MAQYLQNPIVDPTDLSALIKETGLETDGTSIHEVVIDTTTKKIKLVTGGSRALTTDGVTLKCLYSFLKEQWKNSAVLIKFPFPMVPITDESFEVVNGWDWDKTGSGSTYTPNLIRTGGWALKPEGASFYSEQWAGIMTLGSLDENDQVYFQQDLKYDTDNTANIVLTGVVNQAVKIYTDTNYDGTPDTNLDLRSNLTLFVRTWGKTYSAANLVDIGVPQMTFQAYRFPLTNTSDVKIASLTGLTEGQAGGSIAPYNDMSLTWYTTNQNQTIGGSSYSFKVIIDANVDNTGGNPTAEQIYAYVQAALRKTTDIDGDGTSVHIGKVTPTILRFVGDDLYTIAVPEVSALDYTGNYEGVYINDFSTTDINRLHFHHNNSLTVPAYITYPYTANIRINFGSFLQTDTAAKYWLFYEYTERFTNTGFSITGASGATATISSATTDLTAELTNGDYIYLSGFATAANNGVWVLTGAPAGTGPWTVAATKVNGATAVNEAAGATVSLDKNAYATPDAILVQDAAGSPADITGTISAAEYVDRTFAYDTNVQGGRTAATPAAVVAVAIGLEDSQYVSAKTTIIKSTANSVSLVSAQERNYLNP